MPTALVFAKRLSFLWLLLTTGCLTGGSASTIGGGPLASGMWVARLAPTGSSFGVRGDARLMPLSRGMQIEFDLRSLAPRARHPWVIRTGRCGESNTRELTPRAGALVEASLDGYARSTSRIMLDLVPGQDYHIVLAASPANGDVYVACGPLIPVG